MDHKRRSRPRPPGPISIFCLHSGQYVILQQTRPGEGKRRKAARKAVVRVLDEWGISQDEYVDPGEIMLRLIAQSARRVQYLADAMVAAKEHTDQLDAGRENEQFLRKIYGDQLDDPMLAVLLVPQYAVTPAGDRVAIGKQISALGKLEAEERDRLAVWCQKAVAAGLEERRVKIAEAEGMHLAAVIRLMSEQLGLSVEQRQLIPSALRQAVNTVYGPQTAAIEGELV